ncbi:MAG: TIGR02099 family protein [Chromatiales bacterium]|nr:MAG: TIGR02099 family protein [Chromatiales bacterium]
MGKLLRGLVYTAASVVIALALLVGLIRLLLPQLTQYQQEVRAAAAAATGFEVQFDRLSASWPLRGPELVLYDVRILDPGTADIIARADEVSVGIDVVTLLVDRRVVPASFGLSGTRLAVERTADGVVRLQGLPLDEWLPPEDEDRPALEKLNVRLNDIDISYSDSLASGEPFLAQLKALELELREDQLVAEGRADVSGGQSGRIEISADATGRLLGPDADPVAAEWRVSLTAEDIDLPPLAQLVAGMPTPLTAATGEITLVARFVGRQPLAAYADLDLRGMEFRHDGDLVERIDLLAGRFEWEQRDPGWLFAASDLRIGREGRIWPRTEATLSCSHGSDGRGRACDASADFLRLEDLYAVFRGIASRDARNQLLPEDLRGEVSDIRLALRQPAELAPRFQLSLKFADLGLVNLPGDVTAAGLAGELVADQAGGRLELASEATEWQWPELFAAPLQLDTLSALMVWRVTDDGLRVLSDSVQVQAGELSGTSRFELLVPADGRSPFMDLDAQVRSSTAVALLDYLPLRRFPPKVGEWLRRAILAGRVEDSSIRWRGPLRAFPYDHGEGVFRAELALADAELDFADRWPPLQSLTATVIFDGVGMSTTRNRGRFANVEIEDQVVGFEDLRKGLLALDIVQPTAVNELRELLLAMPIADSLGAVLTRMNGQGDIDARMTLRLPVMSPSDYRLNAIFDARTCDLGFQGLAFQLDGIRGIFELENTRLSADRLDATLLGEPVQVTLRPAGDGNRRHSHFALLTSRTPLRRWMETLELPQPDKFSGAADWRAMVALPRGGPDSGTLQLAVQADLTAVESRLPPPFAQQPGQPAPLALRLDFQDEVLAVDGRLRDNLAWVFRMERGESGWAIERGALHSGYGPALLPMLPGIELSGNLDTLRLADWIALADGDATQRWLELYREVAFSVEDLVVFGQHFRDAEVFATRQPGAWRIALDAPWALGTVIVPDVPAPQRPLRVDMERLWLREAETGDGEPTDPRTAPPMAVQVGDFRLGELNFGTLNARVDSNADGLVASPIQTAANSFEIAGDAAWLVLDGDVARQRTRLRGELRTDDVKQTLVSLAYQPLIQSKSGRVTADVSWPGPPAADFLAAASGQVQIRIEEGALLDVEPGGGRVLGMLSVAALPRRLALDFRDVFDEGLSFNVLEGNFTLESGEAYTCNLGLEGGVADVGIVGRTSMSEETYDQLAVVRPHVSNVLALGGAVVGGPGVGAAMLLISRIFRKPLSQIGESYYEIQGSWEQPNISKTQRIDVDTTRFSNCEALLPEVLPEVVLVPLPETQPVQPEPVPDTEGGDST